MVNISSKSTTARRAVARVEIFMQAETQKLIEEGGLKKGNVLSVAEIAAVMGAKQTAQMIPLCHPVPLEHVSVRHEFLEPLEGQSRLQIEVEVAATYRTGIEMEALHACSVAALTVYDMCKAVDRAMTIERLRVVYKSGGKSGTFEAE
ncbi:cyclic pyranopterin monophosphate synthase MoaC [Alicyclobacillus sp. TC]|nr:cyclic pyranopterin monophosphate synthase MoaC [Alicyclobacillus sp. TC]